MSRTCLLLVVTLLSSCGGKSGFKERADLSAVSAVDLSALAVSELGVSGDGGSANCVLAPSDVIATRLATINGKLAAAAPKSTTTVRDMLFQAAYLLLFGNDLSRAESMIQEAMKYQCLSPDCVVPGLFLFHTTDMTNDMGPTGGYDYNSTAFVLQALIPMLAQLPLSQIALLQPHLDAALQALQMNISGVTPNDAYTNIWLMRATDLVLIGEFMKGAYGNAYQPYVDSGYTLLSQWATDTTHAAITEYDSPTYYGTDLDSLTLGARLAKNPAPFVAALNYVWTDIAANYFPASGTLSGPHSRDYDFVYGSGSVETYLWLAGWRNAAPLDTSSFEPVSGAIFAYANARAGNGYQPSSTLFSSLACAQPKRVTQRWGAPTDAHPHDRSNYVGANFSLGVTSLDYVDPMQEKIVSLELPNVAAISLVTEDDTTDDNPYGAKVTQGLFDKPYRVGSFPVAVQKDGLALITSYAAPIASNPAPKLLTSNILLPRAAVIMRNGAVVSAADTPLSLATGDIIGVHGSGAAAAIRVFRALDCAGTGATPILKFESATVDGSVTDVARIVVYHQASGDAGTSTSGCAAPFGLLLAGVDCGDGACGADDIVKSAVVNESVTSAGQWSVNITVGATTLALTRVDKFATGMHAIVSRLVDGTVFNTDALDVNGAAVAPSP
jgi:hypothetical protein